MKTHKCPYCGKLIKKSLFSRGKHDCSVKNRIVEWDEAISGFSLNEPLDNLTKGFMMGTMLDGTKKPVLLEDPEPSKNLVAGIDYSSSSDSSSSSSDCCSSCGCGGGDGGGGGGD